VKFLVDNQLPVSLAQFFIERGFHAEHVLHLKMEEASDAAIWRYAAANGMIVVSKDEDFTYLITMPGAVQLVWVRLGNCRNVDLFEAFELALPQLETALKRRIPIIEIH
jgi:predicted nuclease of predicted toxin-antitoxin system